MQNWVCTNCAPAACLPARLFGSHPSGGSIGLSAPPRKKAAEPETLRPDGSSPCVAHRPRYFEQLARVEIEYRLGVGLVAGRRIVAPQHQQVAHAGGRRRHQIALQGDTIAVAAGELEDRFDAFRHQHAGGGNRGEMRPRAGTVGNVHGVGEAFERQRLGE